MTKPPFVIPSLIFLLLSIPLVLGRIPKNRLYGIRTRKTLSDERLWYAVNRLGGRLIVASSLIYLATASLVPYSTDSTSPNWWAHVAAFVLPLAASLLTIHFYSKRL
jgi:hypothetical protein